MAMFKPNKAELVAKVAAQLMSGNGNLKRYEAVQDALKIVNFAQRIVDEEHQDDINEGLPKQEEPKNDSEV